ncbi:MAG TPA: heparinase II/III family protein [Opitutaceae bacterium]
MIDDAVVQEGRLKEDRQIYEVPMRLRLTRLNAFVLAEGLANQGEFLPAIEKEVSAILDEAAWIVGGALAAEIDTPKRTHIDLVTAPRAWTLATADYWLGERLSPALRRRLRAQLEERVFTPYLEDARAEKKRFFWLESETNNWGPVCHAGVVGAALAVVDSREQRARIVHTALSKLGGYLNGWSMSPDGLCLEGVGYWDYGFGNYALLAETLWRGSAGRINLYRGERVRQVATATRGLELSHGTYPSFADCAVYMRPNVAILWLIKERFGLREPGWPDAPDGAPSLFRPEWAFQELPGRPDPEELAGALFALHPQGDRLAAFGIFAFPFVGGVANDDAPARVDPLRSVFVETGLAVLREIGSGRPALSLAVKGGNNGEPHGHHDQGSYVIAVDGWPLLLDPGAELYTPATFDRRRYDSMMNNSLGHPVPLVAGKPQRAGAAARSVMQHTNAGNGPEVIALDLTACYDVPELRKLTRTFSFFRQEQRIEIVDEAEFSEARTFGTAFVTNSAWQGHAPGAFTVSDGGVALDVTVESDTGELHASTQPVTAPRQKPGIAPTRLGYDLREPGRVVRIKATIAVRAPGAR